MTTFHRYCITASGEEWGEGSDTALFPYWSFTKTVIAICALRLSENGVLDLDSPVSDEPFTLRQLLMHISGLPDYGILTAYHAAVTAGEEPWSRDVLLSAVMAKGRLFSPGEGWAYSNVGYMLARERIEAASGLSFSHLVDEMICQPLSLKSIALATTAEQFSHLHCEVAGKYHPGWVYHGCLTGNVSDAARLLQGLFSGKLIGAASLAEMQVRYPLGGAIEGRPWTECGYGMGLMMGATAGAGRAVGHSGCGPSCVNAVYHFPDLKDPMTVACFTAGSQEGIAETETVRLAQERG